MILEKVAPFFAATCHVSTVTCRNNGNRRKLNLVNLTFPISHNFGIHYQRKRFALTTKNLKVSFMHISNRENSNSTPMAPKLEIC